MAFVACSLCSDSLNSWHGKIAVDRRIAIGVCELLEKPELLWFYA